MSHSISTKLLPAATLALGFIANPAQAAVMGGHSEGYGLQLDASILSSLISLDTGAVPTGAAGSMAPPTSYDTGLVSLASLNMTAGTFLNPSLFSVEASAGVGTCVLCGRATGDMTDPSAGSATGYGAVNSLSVDLAADVAGLLAGVVLSADTLYSNSAVTGDYGNFTPTGSSAIENLSLSLFGIQILSDFNLLATAAPNTAVDLSVLGLAEISLILNEQEEVCEADSCKQETNALHLNIGALSGKLLDVDLILGHSEAYLEAASLPSSVPAPNVLALLGIGLLGLAGARSRQS